MSSKQRRRSRALARQKERSLITDQMQIARLIERFHPHCREVERLRERIWKGIKRWKAY